MKNSLRLILLLLLPILAQANPTAFDELWGHTANVLDSLPVDSSTPTLNPLSRQIDLSETDIKGPLPFSRIYRSSLTIGLDQASLSDEDTESLNYYTKGRSSVGMGWGWRHQYNYRTYNYKDETGLGIRTPSELYPSWYTFNGSSIVNQMTGKVAGTYTSAGTDSQGNLRPETVEIRQASGLLVLERHKRLAGHEVSDGSKEVDVWLVAKLKQNSGYAIDFNYEFADDPDLSGDEQFLLSSISDKRGNKLVLHRKPFDHEETGFTFSSVREGLITRVDQHFHNSKQPTQTVEYEFEEMIAEGPETNVRFDVLSSVRSTVNPYVRYTYHEPEVIGVTAEGGNKYTLPVINTLFKNSQVMRTWEYGDNFIGTYSDANRSDYAKIEFTIARVTHPNTYIGGTYPLATLKVYPMGSSDSDNYSVTSISGKLQVDGLADSKVTALRSGDSGFSEILTFKSTGYLKIRDRTKGLVKMFSKDSSGRLTGVSEMGVNNLTKWKTIRYERLSDYSLNPYNSPNSISSAGISIRNVLNTRGQITHRQIRSGPKLRFESFFYEEDANHPAFGELIGYDGPREDINDRIEYEYNRWGEKILKRTYDGTESPYITHYVSYNSLGLPTVVIDTNGNATKSYYDTKLRLVKTERGLSSGKRFIPNNGPITQYKYNYLNLLTQLSDADNSITKFNYGPRGELVGKSMDAYYSNEEYVYESGRLVRVKYGRNYHSYETVYEYDNSGQLISEYDGKGTNLTLRNTYEYDANGAMIRREFPTAVGLGVELTKYDEFGRVISNTNAAGEQVTFGYNSADDLMSQIYQNGTGSSFTPWAIGLVKEESNSDYGLTTFEYDGAKNVIFKARAPAECQNNFNSMGQLKTLNCIHTSSNDKYDSKGYDFNYQKPGSVGLLTSATPLNSWSKSGITGYQGVKTDYEYNANYQVVKKTQHNGLAYESNLINLNQTVDYTYTPAGRLSTIIYPSGRQISYNYNTTNKDEVNEIWVGNTMLTSSIEYVNQGKIAKLRFAADSAETEFYNYYNDDGSLKRQILWKFAPDGVSRLEDFVYSYYPNKQLKKQTAPGGTEMTYGYDILGQLTSESRLKDNFSQQASYSYDSNGNRTSQHVTNSAFSYNLKFNHANNVLTSINTGQGETENAVVEEDGVTSFPSVFGEARYDAYRNKRSQVSTYTGSNLQYDYNHKNERTTQIGANQLRHFVYDESNHLIGEYDNLGNPILEYVWLDDKPVAALYPNNRIVYLITDSRNAPRRGYDLATNELVWAWDPDAFGVALPHIKTVEMNLRFPGQYYDEATDLHYNHHRNYSPQLGRYLEPDPIGLEGGRNPYSYAGNDPVNSVDPSGLYNTAMTDMQMSNTNAYNGYNSMELTNMIHAIDRDINFQTQMLVNNAYVGNGGDFMVQTTRGHGARTTDGYEVDSNNLLSKGQEIVSDSANYVYSELGECYKCGAETYGSLWTASAAVSPLPLSFPSYPDGSIAKLTANAADRRVRTDMLYLHSNPNWQRMRSMNTVLKGTGAAAGLAGAAGIGVQIGGFFHCSAIARQCF